MATTAIVDLTCAVFLTVIFSRRITKQGLHTNLKQIILCLVTLLVLIFDAAAYIFVGPKYPAGLKITLFVVSCIIGAGMIILGYIYYLEELFSERMKLPPWMFRSLKVVEWTWLLVSVAFALSGPIRLDPDSQRQAVEAFPATLKAISILILLLLSVIAISKHKALGTQMTIVICLFNMAPIFAYVLYLIAPIDFTYSACAVSFLILDEYIRERQTEFIKEEQERKRIERAEMEAKHEVLQRNYDRIFALEDTFESLYDVELSTGHYSVYVKGDFYRENVLERLSEAKNYFEDLKDNIETVIYQDDREALYRAQSMENITKELQKSDHFDFYYRIISQDGPLWFKLRTVYKDVDHQNIIIGVFNAEEEMAAKEKETEYLENTKLLLRHEQLRAELSNYMVDHEDDPIELLKQFAEKLRVLIGCDQVIYRDLDETRIMVNSDGIAETWAVPIEYCRQCEHFNAHHPMYKDGYTEMDNCQEGWQGIPVYHDCPIKSSLTRIVYCDGDVAGYLAIHYVVDYHHFTDMERATLEEFARILSLSLSRYAAKQRVGELNDVKRFLNVLFSLSDQFDPIIVINPETGAYNWFQSKAQEIEDLTAMSIRGDNLYADVIKDADTILHEEDREQYKAFYTKENILKIAKTGETQETENRWRVGENGTYLWKYNKAVRMEDDNGKVFVVVGVVDTTEQKNKQKEEENVQKLISSISSAYSIVYEVNWKDDSFILIRMDQDVIGYENEYSCFSEVKDFFVSLLPKKDQKGMRHELEYAVIQDKLKETETYSVLYRVKVDGSMLWYEMNITKIDDDNIAIGFAEKDLEITKKHLEDKRFSEYFALYEIDIDSGMMKIVKDSPYYGIDRSGTSMPYKEAMLKFASGLDDEPKAFFEQMADMDYVKTQFATEDKSTYAYRSNNVGSNWVDCTGYVTMRHEDGTPAMFTFGFSLLDSLGVYRQELQGKYVEQNAVLVAQQEELEDAREAADAANLAKSNFLFSMSHDIRTPMNAIRGFTTMAKKHVHDVDKVTEYLEKIDISGQQLLTLVNQVLEMARIESGKVEIEEKPVSILDEYNAMVTVLSEQANVNGLKFEASIKDIVHNNVLADEAKIGSIILNIAGNAMKYTPEGGSVAFGVKEIKARKAGYTSVVFTVADTGMGMSKEYLEKLYEPFTREKSSTVSKIQGTGLGMSIVKNIVDLMGGEIEVWSEPNKGTKFDITIDFKIDNSTPAHEEEEENFEGVSLENRRVLLVEDNEMNREIAKDILEDQGLFVEDADDGDVAVSMVSKAFDRGDYGYYDFVLMDVQMPRMSGYEATKAIRQLPVPDGVHLPIIAMTANAFEEDRKNALDAGMDEHLAKPIDAQKMFMTIARFLK